MKRRKAFTLIELLVVIAIIGILASIVLVSLRGATKKAKDARITSDLTQVRSISELINGRDTSYTSLCALDGSDTTKSLNTADTDYGSQLKTVQDDVDSQIPSTFTKPSGDSHYVVCQTDGTDYCVFSTLISKTNTWYCIDSTGFAGEVTTDPSGTCNSSSYTCK